MSKFNLHLEQQQQKTNETVKRDEMPLENGRFARFFGFFLLFFKGRGLGVSRDRSCCRLDRIAIVVVLSVVSFSRVSFSAAAAATAALADGDVDVVT